MGNGLLKRQLFLLLLEVQMHLHDFSISLAMIEAISFISSSLNPREVTAGVPRRTPEVMNGLIFHKELCFCLL